MRRMLLAGLLVLCAIHRTAHAQNAKGVFEPVNYQEDVNLTDVFFVNTDVGWVSGEHATILATVDAGKTWNAQVGGDPNNSDRRIRSLRFVDAVHGWAVLAGAPERFLHTDDGQNWDQIGEFARGTEVVDYAFTSLAHGIALGANGSEFYITDDGGRTWQQRGTCQVRAKVQGLPRTEGCRFRKLQMLSASTGYVLVDWSGGTAFLKTEDGGARWTSIVPQFSDCCDPDVFFTTADNAVLYFNNGKTYLTNDGARTWHALLSGGIGVGNGARKVSFADPQIGWVMGASPDNSGTFRISFSTDGGQHWKSSRNLPFPIRTFEGDLRVSFPRRDRAYVVGPHGMIYRYSVVPAGDTAAGALTAPPMPPLDASSLSTQAQRIRDDVQAVRAQLASAASTTAAGSPDKSPSTPVAAEASEPAPSTSPVAACCASALQSLQADVAAFAEAAPQTATRFRSLNLVISGLQLATSVLNQADQLRGSLATLRQAPSLDTATNALQQLSAIVSSTEQGVRTALQNPGASSPSATAAAAQSPAAAQADPATTASLPDEAAPAQPQSAPPPQATPDQSGGSQGVVEGAVQEGTRKLKDTIKVPW